MVLHGSVIINEFGQPRYWATIWADVLQASLDETTRNSHLGAIDHLYRHVAGLGGDLDASIAACNFEELEAALGGFLVVVRNESALHIVNGNKKWTSALRFVTETVDFLSKSRGNELAHVQARLLRIKTLYSQLSPAKPKSPQPIRALPAIVLEELYGIFNPESARNPYRSKQVRWRNFAIFLLLLHLGIRRGELLTLTTGAIMDDLDYKTGEIKYWLNVSNLVDPEEHQYDSRINSPSIKTAQSLRQLPLSLELLKVLDAYVSNFRGTPPHRFLINSQKNFALDITAVNKIFNMATANLSDRALKILRDRGRNGVTPHDLRHTAAVYRLKRYTDQGDEFSKAVGKLRAFFGWSYTSNMPRHYARAYFETELAEVWNDQFDSFVANLRDLEGKSI